MRDVQETKSFEISQAKQREAIGYVKAYIADDPYR